MCAAVSASQGALAFAYQDAQVCASQSTLELQTQGPACPHLGVRVNLEGCNECKHALQNVLGLHPGANPPYNPP